MLLHTLATLVFPIMLLGTSRAQTPPNFAFNASNPLILQFNSTVVLPQGKLLSENVVGLPPTLSTTTKLPGTYLAILVDPTAGTPTNVLEVLHYILPGLTSANTSTSRNRTSFYPLVTDAKPLAPYLVPAPPPGHVHTYTATLWKQPDGFAVPDAFLNYLPLNLSNVTNRYPFNLTDFVTAAGLGQPIAGGYFDLLNTTGSATATGGPSTSQGSSTPTGKLWRPVVRPRYEVREAV